MADHPAIGGTHKYHEMTREEKQLWWFQKLNYIWTKMPEARKRYFFGTNNLRYKWYYSHVGQASHVLHLSMFTWSMNTFCDEE